MPILAYHQVGAEDWEPEEREEAVREIAEEGRILPASMRLDAGEMEAECFTDPERGGTIRERFRGASSKVIAALEEIARKKIAKLPDSGVTHSLFNCVDLVAGDLEVVFLTPGRWYSVPTGFVFDAEELLRKGARFREEDMLGGYTGVIEGASDVRHASVAEARRYIERELADIHKYFESTGREGIERMREARGELRELVWPGPLPLRLAVGAWIEDEDVTRELL